MNQAERFMAAFEGFSAAHGQTQISDERRAGKQKGEVNHRSEATNLELIVAHLEGKHGVGSIPINENSQCKFGALDIDQYPLDLVALDKKLRDNDIPCVVCRSKSGGAHIFFFFTEFLAQVFSVTKPQRLLPTLDTVVAKYSRSKKRFLSSVAMLETSLTFRTLMRNRQCVTLSKKTETKRTLPNFWI